jgi:hypothetical protein
MNHVNMFPVDNNCILEWQLTRLRQALRTSLADMDSYSTYPGRLEAVLFVVSQCTCLPIHGVSLFTPSPPIHANP